MVPGEYERPLGDFVGDGGADRSGLAFEDFAPDETAARALRGLPPLPASSVTVLGPTWSRTVKAGDVSCVVTVGEHALYVRRVDGGEPTEAEHRAALAEALSKAVAEIHDLRDVRREAERMRAFFGGKHPGAMIDFWNAQEPLGAPEGRCGAARSPGATPMIGLLPSSPDALEVLRRLGADPRAWVPAAELAASRRSLMEIDHLIFFRRLRAAADPVPLGRYVGDAPLDEIEVSLCCVGKDVARSLSTQEPRP